VTRTLLVTGFGPFPRVPVNPSAELAARIAGDPRLRRLLGKPPRLLILRTAYEAIPAMLEPALSQHPDAVLMIGVAGRARRVRVETRALNRASRLFPDASGRVAGRLALDRDGPAIRRSAPAARVLVALRRRGLAAKSSRDAGRYLCNASYFRALAESCPVVFLHIPPLPRVGRRTTLDLWTQAGVEAALALCHGTGTSSVRRSTDSR